MKVIVDFCTFGVLVNFYVNLASAFDKVKAQYLIYLVFVVLVFISLNSVFVESNDVPC